VSIRTCRGSRGFRDSVNVGTGTPSQTYLSLDQGMIMALGNALGDDVLRRAFATPDLTQAIRPVVASRSSTSSRAAARSRAWRATTASRARRATT
jgi:hypothetical protein